MAKERDLEVELHAAEAEGLEARIMELALERTGTQSGALFVWDPVGKVLCLDFHVVEGVTVNLPGARLRRRKDGRSNGIAFWALDQNEPYVCPDTSKDAHYARYFLDVASVLAVPVPYQDRAIGVLSVSSRRKDAFGAAHVDALAKVARAAAKHLRRAQLARASRREDGRPFVIKGLCAEWLEVERRLEKVAATDAPVLIQGESGTGKDLVARALHFNSTRHDKPMVVVNCAAIPDTLLESTLFGHVRGAFTGANFDKVGEFRKAHGGTLFLDEIGDLPLMLQAKVLRAVEHGEVEPLGSNKPTPRVDVRLLCATHRDLAQMVRQGRFRDDLYFRLSVVTLELPPLRAYKEHLEVLAAVFVQQAATRHKRPPPRIAPAAMARLWAYDFPGNMRELRNVMEHAVILSTGSELTTADLPRSVLGDASAQLARDDRAPPTASHVVAMTSEPALGPLSTMRERWLAPLERAYLQALLESTGGNVREAARRAEVDAVTLYRLLRKREVAVRRERTFTTK